MLYNFTKFAEWGANPFGESLDKVTETQSYSGCAIRVPKPTAGLDTCQVLFIACSENKRMAETLHSAEGKPVLTVSDIDHFTRLGGRPGFVIVDNRVRFSVNPSRAAQAGIAITSKLLPRASSVETGGN